MHEFVQFWDTYHAWAIGITLIGLSSYGRFNTPPTSRSSTTWGRYHCSLFIYVLVTIVVWILLANTPELLEYLGSQARFDSQAKQFTAPLYAALVFTVLVSTVRSFRQADEKLRAFFQDLARIPWEAKRLSAALRAKTWLPSPRLQDHVRAALHTLGFEQGDISFSDDGSPQALWTRITALHYHLNKWRSGEPRRFAAFHYENSAEFQKINDDYDALGVVSKRIFRLLDALSAMKGELQLAAVQKELIDRFNSDAVRLERTMCDLISRALLQSALTERRRREECESMGFLVNVASDPTFDRILLLYLVMWVWYVLTLSFAHRPYAALTGTIIPTIYVGAIVSARYPKRWAWARRIEGHRPIRGYVLSGLLAIAFAIVVSFCLGLLRTWDIEKTATLLIKRWWPWSLMAGFTAAVTAYNIDNDENSPGRWIEAGLQATIGVLGAGLVYAQLSSICEATSDPNCAPSAARLLLSAAFTGGLIGWFVPTWSREPETMIVEYRGWKLVATTRLLRDGHFTSTITVAAPRPEIHIAVPTTSHVLEEEFSSSEEALAKAVEYARKQIDGKSPERLAS